MSVVKSTTATLSIDRDIIAANWSALDGLSSENCVTSAVIKADGYGLGMVPVSQRLYQAGCRCFFTARLEEAITLRTALNATHASHAKIMVLDGLSTDQAVLFAEYDLIPVLNDLGQIGTAKQAASKNKQAVPVCLHSDTAMARLGLSAKDRDQLLADQTALEGLDISYLLSHLASSDDKQSPQNQTQLGQFHAHITQLSQHSSSPVKASLANSGGIFLGSDYHFDMTRPGIALYGITADEADQKTVRNCFSLSADILQIREVPKGTSVGYGASFITPRPMRLATLGIGYADGILRHYQPHLKPRIGGYACPMVGRISMDSCVIDISDIPEGVLANQMAAILFDDDFTPADLAPKIDSIAYEIMTMLGERLARHYDGAKT